MSVPVHITDAAFAIGAASIESLPPGDLPEVAFAGRSNVGKSSLLQRLLGRKEHVRVSSTPGRTRQINLFVLTLSDGRRISLADLPGYGYAHVSHAERKKWGPLLESYLETRQTLRCVVVIVDARRGAMDDDVMLIEYLRSIEQPSLVIATKVDKLAKNKVKPIVQDIGRALGTRAIPFSAVTGEGRDAVWAAVLDRC